MPEHEATAGPPGGTERRAQPRFAIELETSVMIAGGEQALGGRSQNLSRSGVFVYLEHELAAGTGVHLILTDSVLRLQVHARGEVVHHVVGLGIGVRFTEVAEADRDNLQLILRHWQDHREQTHGGRWVRADDDGPTSG